MRLPRVLDWRTSHLLVSALVGAGLSAYGGTPRDLLRMEDRIDRLAPARQVDEYLKLRKLLLEERGPGSQVALSRLALKLALANARAAATAPDFAQRLSFCRQASEIGESYLKQGDPVRALSWERICRGIEADSKWASVLRNQINEWFENRLYRWLVARDWPGARGIIGEWRGLMEKDHAVEEGIGAYASARVEDLKSGLQSSGGEAVLSALAVEERHYPGLEAWNSMRKLAADSLQQPFDKAIAERRVDDAKAALSAQTEIAAQFTLAEELAPIEVNAELLKELVKALEPPPLERPYGHVRAPAFRLDVGGLTGPVRFEDRDETIEQSASSLRLSLNFRQRGSDEKKWWFGMNLNGMNLTAIDGLASGDALFAGLNGLAGRRGRKWLAWVGLGVAYVQIDFTGLSISDKGSGMIVGNVKLGGERAVSRSLTVHGDLEWGGWDELSHWQARLGGRYYANPSLAIDLHVIAGEIRAKDHEAGAVIDVRNTSAGIAVLMQF